MLEGELENGGDFGQIGHDGLLHSMGVATKECSRAILIRCTVPYWEFLVVLRRMLFERIPRAFPIHVAHMGGVKRG